MLRNTGYWPDINGEASASAGALTPNDSGENFPVEANGGFEGDEPQPGPSGLQEKGMKFFRLGGFHNLRGQRIGREGLSKCLHK